MTIKAIQTFQPEPWQIPFFYDKSKILVGTGSAGGGKSTVAAEKMHAYCLHYPGASVLAVRKTRESMTNSTIALFMHVMGIGQTNQVRHAQDKKRFEYRNGSMLMYGGMADEKQRKAIRSIGQQGGLDMWWMEEAIEFVEADYDELLPRLRGKATNNYWRAKRMREWQERYKGKIPSRVMDEIEAEAERRSWRQGMLTTNPDSPLHWIYTRLIQGGEGQIYYSKASDNRHNPDDYVETLDQTRGTQRQRLRDGLWVKAEGVIYGEWLDDYGQAGKPAVGNVQASAVYEPGAGPLYWAIDDGYSVGSRKDTVRGMDPKTGSYVADAHPRAILIFQQKPDGHVDLIHEDYACLELPDVQLDRVEALGLPDPEWVVHGPGAATLRGHIYAHNHYPKSCKVDVKDSIKLMREWLAPDRNGWRRLRVNPACKQFRAEMASYAYEPDGETPAKAFDHGPDGARYLAVKLSRELA